MARLTSLPHPLTVVLEWEAGRSAVPGTGSNVAPSVGQKAELADAHESWGKHVEQKAAQELLDRQGHQALLVAVRGVSPAAADSSPS